MGRIARYAFDFAVAMWGAITLAAISFVDPLDALKGLGMNLGYHWTITPDQRRALFLALAFAWMFVWYYRNRVRYEASKPSEPTIPLYLACRWIARDSVWAARLNPANDDHWAAMVDEAIMAKVMQGRIELFGKRRRNGAAVAEPMQHVAPAFKSEAQWDCSNLVTDNPPTHMWQAGGDVYLDVHLDFERVKAVWPRKRVLDRLLKRSPIERIGGWDYGGKFEKQDANYKKMTIRPLSGYEALFGADHGGN